MSFLEEVNTKLEAYKLIHDPCKLLTLLYSKYGDIEEDFNVLYINQIMYNRSSHYNTIFHEFQIEDFIDEFLKRYYYKHESVPRIPKLSEYYKNYHNFFCRPIFRNFKYTNLMHNYGDNKAEVFYKNNYGNDEENKENENKENKNINNNNNDENDSESSSLSSLDNITNNKTIFDKKTRQVIDNNTSNKGTITLTLDESTRNSLKDFNNKNNNNNELYSKRSLDNSFIKTVSYIINYKPNRKKKNIIIKNNKLKSELKHGLNINLNLKKVPYILNKQRHYQNININNINKKPIISSTVSRSNYNSREHNNNHSVKNSEKKIILSPKHHFISNTYRANIEEINLIKPKYSTRVNSKNKNNNNNNNNSIMNLKNRNIKNSNNFLNAHTSTNSNLNNNNIINSNNTFRNKTLNYSNNTSNPIRSNLKHFSKLSSPLSNTLRESLNKNPNKQKHHNTTYHNYIQKINKNKKKKNNKTFDIKSFNNNNNNNNNFKSNIQNSVMNKFNSNGNFSALSSNKKRKNYIGSSFNLIKTPLIIILMRFFQIQLKINIILIKIVKIKNQERIQVL